MPGADGRADAMKIVMLGPASVIHTQRWAAALAERGLDIVLATQHPDAVWQAYEELVEAGYDKYLLKD